MKQRAVIDKRVSTKEQVGNYSLEDQERFCRRYCEAEGIEVDSVWTEEGESAKTTNRPRLQELLSYYRKNHLYLNFLVVADAMRFSRDMFDFWS